MSEIPITYHTGNELEIALKDLERMLREVTENPAASIWLRKAIAELWQRDSIEALEDLAIAASQEEVRPADVGSLGRIGYQTLTIPHSSLPPSYPDWSLSNRLQHRHHVESSKLITQ